MGIALHPCWQSRLLTKPSMRSVKTLPFFSTKHLDRQQPVLIPSPSLSPVRSPPGVLFSPPSSAILVATEKIASKALQKSSSGAFAAEHVLNSVCKRIITALSHRIASSVEARRQVFGRIRVCTLSSGSTLRAWTRTRCCL